MKERIERVLSKKSLIGLVAGVAVALVALVPAHASAAPAAGPGNPYPQGMSTHWAWQNRPDLPANLGEAKEWNERAAAQGWPVTAQPRHMSVAVYEPGVQGAHKVWGRVGIVQQVYGDGAYLSSYLDDAGCQAGAAPCDRPVQQKLKVVAGVSFVHYKKDTRTTWGFAGGAAGWSAKDLGQGSASDVGWYYPVAGADPQLVSPELDLPLDGYNALEITMLTSREVAEPAIQIYFATGSLPDFSRARFVSAQGQADGVARTYKVYLASHRDWKGQLTRLRIDPAGPGNKGGVRMDRVRLVKLDPATETLNAFAVSAPLRDLYQR